MNIFIFTHIYICQYLHTWHVFRYLHEYILTHMTYVYMHDRYMIYVYIFIHLDARLVHLNIHTWYSCMQTWYIHIYNMYDVPFVDLHFIQHTKRIILCIMHIITLALHRLASRSWAPIVPWWCRQLWTWLVWNRWGTSWISHSGRFQTHPWRWTWNIIMELWKTTFLSKWGICRFHVNLPGCKEWCKELDSTCVLYFKYVNMLWLLYVFVWWIWLLVEVNFLGLGLFKRWLVVKHSRILKS